MTTGLIIGKFMPPHRGHELLIDIGLDLCSKLDVMVSGRTTDRIPVHDRVQWLRSHFYPKVSYTVPLTLQFHPDFHDDIPDPRVDADGTALDEWYWDIWISRLKDRFGSPDILLSSDIYGKRLARELGAKWIPVDPGRTSVPISATMIRGNPLEKFQFLIPTAKRGLSKTVALLGPESSGKTTLAKILAEYYQTAPVPEYGRMFTDHYNKPTSDDFNTIVRAQHRMIEDARWHSPVVIADTEALTTYMWSTVYLPTPCELALTFAEKQNFDLYIVLSPNVTWVDDGTRMMEPKAQRDQFFNSILKKLDEYGKNYVVVDDPHYAGRVNSAKKAVDNMLASAKM